MEVGLGVGDGVGLIGGTFNDQSELSPGFGEELNRVGYAAPEDFFVQLGQLSTDSDMPVSEGFHQAGKRT